MSDPARQRELTEAVHAAVVRARQGAARYEEKQRQARSGRGGADYGARPLQFDEKGFPISQRTSTLAERVARLLNPF